MAGQSAQLTRKEATSLQRKAEQKMGDGSMATGHGGDTEHCSQKGVKSNPKGAKG